MDKVEDIVGRLRRPVTLSGMQSSVSVYQETIVDRSRAADLIQSQQALIEEMREALEPFASEVTANWANEYGWTDRACQKDRICDWFGPSDFLAARKALSQKE